MARSLFRTKNIDKILRDAETMADDPHAGTGLKRVLTLRDLTFFGIAAIIGAGSFSSLGQACYNGGPGVVVLFIICAVACGFTALCYSEFASRIPVAGSAYTYAYASFGELFAWIIGWALIMEYSIGNIYVAFSWSDYFTLFMSRIGIHIPDYLTCSYMEAHQAVTASASMAASGITSSTQELINAWNHAPMIGGLRIIFDMPALIICVLITSLVYVGVKESRNFSNIMVILKLCIIVLVIAVGAYYVNPENWTPLNPEGVRSFMPNGFSGVMRAVSGVFFAYIGFDAISVMAEESKNPQRDLPRSMILSLVICTVIYILLTLVLTGVVSYEKFNNVGDPLAKIFQESGNGWMQFLVSMAAVIAMTSVLLVFQMGQPRIWMSMSRDGLLPSRFEKIHPKYQTPSFATIVTGLVVGVPLLFTDKVFVLDFTSIATLFAFVLVCGGVLLIPKKEKVAGRFSIPYINGKIIFPAIVAAALIILQLSNKNYISSLFQITEDNASLNVSTIIFWVIMILLGIISLFKNWSLIPLLGLSSCLYLLTGMTGANWAWFGSWLVLGLIIYFMYGYRKSKLNAASA
ncbi:MAG TPA: amino acid permease [Parafilimonas sp.]|nr:amino acid permease [Parafilimonas sp.]